MTEKAYLDIFLSRELGVITDQAPERLRMAAVHAVFPGGGRVRPLLSLHIAKALNRKIDDVALAAAGAVELIHCASLAHDDMPCFDNADFRRGKPSVHRQFGENTALLVGDGLIAGAFEVLAKNAGRHPNFSKMVQVLAQATGASKGLVSGQAWEDQPGASVSMVHDRKTAALFEAAAVLAALVAGVDETPWRALGKALGAAYQAADDILDAAGSAESAGKPVLQDSGRRVTSAVKTAGLSAAVRRFNTLVDQSIEAIPDCPGRDDLVQLVRGIATRLCPPSLVRKASVHRKTVHRAHTGGSSVAL
jgi:geranylgeranyl diphosphate synthase type II